MQSKAKTPVQYLSELPPDRQVAISKVRSVIREHLHKGYVETMLYGMLCWVVPLSRYPQGYLNNKSVPICYIGLASQKNYMSLYLTNVYGDPKVEHWFREEYKKRGIKLDMGKSCVRFKKLEDIPLDVIGEEVGKTTVDQYIKMYEAARKSIK